MTEEHSEDWSPDDGAGYIPTEEGGKGRARSSDDVDRVLGLIEQEAAEHGGDYAAGLRNARHIVETELDH